MKHIGVVGVSAEGAALTISTICSEASKRIDFLEHPEISFNEVSSRRYYDSLNDWEKAAKYLMSSLEKLAQIGADFAIIPSNTFHFAYDYIKDTSPIPVLSLIEVVKGICIKNDYKQVALLGTNHTVENRLYRDLENNAGVELLTPNEDDQKRLHELIFTKLSVKDFGQETIDEILAITEKLKQQGAQVVILGCTELPLAVNAANSPIPVIDTTFELSLAALEHAMD